MRAFSKLVYLGLTIGVVAIGTKAGAQQPAAEKLPSPDVGALAPDFVLSGATRYGVLKDSVRLSNYRGKTVVLAFFFKARTKG